LQFNNIQDAEQRDMNALKRELSLDLQPLQSRLPQPANRAATLPVKEHLQAAAAAAMCSSPNNSNFTDNTSQSVTPSEYGYQHLQRQLSMHSLLATDDSSPVYEDFEQTPVKMVPTSPIKSTISITYKSPEKEKKPAPLLETNFDENIVYEQVKLFRNSVTEVNQMLHERSSLKQIAEEEQQDGGAFRAAEMTQQLLQLEQDQQQEQHQEEEEPEDEEQSQLLYENIELRKPKTVYENLRGEEMKFIIEDQKPSSDRIELDSLDSLPDNMEHEHTSPSKSPSFSVKELANKFESSPVEQLPSFDFSVRGGSMKKPNELSVPKAMPAPVPLKKLNSSAQKITRSLDENAFVREFGGKQLQDLSVSGKLPEVMSEVNSRRKSFDFTRPKTLNPPKRLPGMSITEEICQKRGGEPEPITPTTENRISLIQQNNMPKEQQVAANQFLPPAGRKNVLTGVILDRERIDKIKEERRQQLTQKYYGDTLKSRSRTELNAEDNFPATESLRIKSKSRGDMHALQKDMDMNLKQLTRVAGGGSESTLHMGVGMGQGNGQEQLAQQRVRRISDEKNQNCDTSNGGVSGVTATSLLSVKTAAQKYGSTSKTPANKFERGQPMPRERLQRNSLAESTSGTK